MSFEMQAIQAFIQSNKRTFVQDLIDFVRVPNNVFIPEQIDANAKVLRNMMERRGFEVECWETPEKCSLVYGERKTKPTNPTILIYGHYDGVPVEPECWHSSPYEPVIRKSGMHNENDDTAWDTIPFPSDNSFEDTWRVYGRSIADSKNAIVAILSAIDCLQAQGIELQVNLKFLLDGEEEIESPNLPALLEQHSEQLKADFLLAASGETHQSGLPTVELGVRGILQFNLEVFTSTADLHSGHFGNFAPSAAFQLGHLVSSLKDIRGRVLVPGFYDQVTPLTPAEEAMIEKVPVIDDLICQTFGISQPECQNLRDVVNQPTLNVRGLQSGFIGEAARNIIPSYAKAELDVRLVKGMDPDVTFQTILSYFERLGWIVVCDAPTFEQRLQHSRILRIEKKAGFPATRTQLESKEAAYVIQSVQRSTGEHMVVLPTEGGSLPLYLFERMGLPVIGLPTSNYDCNQHTHDENLQLGYFFKAIEMFASLFMGSR